MRELTTVEILQDNAGYNNTLGLSWRDPVTGELKGVIIAWDSDETAGVRVGDNGIAIPEDLAARIDWDSAQLFLIPDGGSRNWRLERDLGDVAGGDAEIFTILNAEGSANRSVKFVYEDGGEVEVEHVGSGQGFDLLFQSEDLNPSRTGSGDPNDSDYTAGDGDPTGDPGVNPAPAGESDFGGETGADQAVVGFEDLVWGSDSDFNDLIIRVTYAAQVPNGSDGADDLVNWSPVDGSGSSDGGTGFDVFEADLSAATSPISISADGGVITIAADGETVDLTNYEEIRLVLGDGDDAVVIAGDFSQTGLGDETIIISGGNGDDLIDASGVTGQNVHLHGQGGNDTLITGNGDDLLDGGDGEDVLDGGAGGNTLTGGADRDTFVFSGGSDTITDFNVQDDDDDSLEPDADRLDLSAFGINAAILDSLAPDTFAAGNRDAMLNGFLNADGDFVRFEFSLDFLVHAFETFTPGFDTDTEDTSDDLQFTIFDADGNALGTVKVLGVDTQEEFVDFFLNSVTGS